MSERSLPAIVTDLYDLLAPCSPEERSKVVSAVFTLLEQALPNHAVRGTEPASHIPAAAHNPAPAHTFGYGPKASRWIQTHGLEPYLGSIFYTHDGKVEVHLDTIAGNSKREQTANCYLIEGVRAYLEKDSPQFADADAVKLAKYTKCYDVNNHTANRKSLGNKINGSKTEGFELSGPGLKAAAALLIELGKAPE